MRIQRIAVMVNPSPDLDSSGLMLLIISFTGLIKRVSIRSRKKLLYASRHFSVLEKLSIISRRSFVQCSGSYLPDVSVS